MPTREECIAAAAAIIFRAQLRIVREQMAAERAEELGRTA